MSRRPSTVTVELIPAGYDRTQLPIRDATYAITERWIDGLMVIHVPDTAAEAAMHPADYARHVADAEGAVFVRPADWIWFAHVGGSWWVAWDARSCEDHHVRDCRVCAGHGDVTVLDNPGMSHQPVISVPRIPAAELDPVGAR